MKRWMWLGLLLVVSVSGCFGGEEPVDVAAETRPGGDEPLPADDNIPLPENLAGPGLPSGDVQLPGDAQLPGAAPADDQLQGDTPANPSPPDAAEKPSAEIVDVEGPVPVEIQRELQGLSAYRSDDVRRLVELIRHENPAVRRLVAEEYDFDPEYHHDEFREFKGMIVPIVAATLDDSQPAVRMWGVRAVQALGSEVKETAPRLMQMLDDPDEEVVAAAARALGAIGPDAGDAVPKLILLAKSDNWTTLNAAARALGDMGEPARPAIPTLVAAVGRGLSWEAPKALGKLGAVEPLLQLATHAESGKRSAAYQGMALLTEKPPEVVAALISGAEDSEDGPALSAVRSLGTVRPTTEAVVAALGKATHHEQDSVRRAAVDSLAVIDPPRESAIPFLLEAMRDKEKYIRSAAINAISKYDANPTARITALIIAAADPDEGVRNSALRRIGGDPDASLPVLREFLRNRENEESLRAAALMLLAELVHDREEEVLALAGEILDAEDEPVSVRACAAAVFSRDYEEHEGVEEALIAGLARGSDIVRKYAAERLDYSTSPAAAAALAAALADKNDEVALAAADGLDTAEEVDAVPALVRAVGDKTRPELRQAAIASLGWIGKGGQQSIPALLPCLKDEDEDIRVTALQAIGEIVEASNLNRNSAAAAVLPLLSDESEYVQGVAAETIGSFGEAGKPAVPTLLRMTAGDDEYARTNAIQALGEIGADADRVVPALIGYVGHEEDALRRAAADALAGFGPAAAPAVDALLAQLQREPDNWCRQRIMLALLRVAPHNEKAQQAVLAQCKDEEVLDELDELGAAVLPLLFKGVEHEDPAVRRNTFAVLREMYEYGDLDEASQESIRRTMEKVAQGADLELAATALALVVEDGEVTREMLPALIASLDHSSDPDDDWRIANAVGSHGRAAAIPLIDYVLRPETARRGRWRAVEILRGLGWIPTSAEERLAAALASDDDSLRKAAAMILAEARPNRADVVPIVLELLESTDPERREAALDALASHREQRDVIAPKVLPLLSDEAESVCHRAGYALGSVGIPQALWPQVLAALDDEQARWAAVSAISASEEPPPEATPRLVALLKTTDDEHDYIVLSALSRLGEAAVPGLLALALDDQAAPPARHRALEGLARFSRQAPQLGEKLEPLLTSDDESLREHAATVMGRCGQADDKSLPLLATALTREDWQLQGGAQSALRELGPRAAALVPQLLELLDSDNVELRQRAAPALIAVGADRPQVGEALVAALDEPQRYPRNALASLIGENLWPGVQPRLIASLDSDKPDQVLGALKALESVGKPAKQAGAKVRGLLGSDDRRVATSAAIALTAIDPAANEATPVLLAALQPPGDAEGADEDADSQDDLRGEAVEALGRLDEPGGEVVDRLVALLDDDDLQYFAFSSLGHLGPAAKSAVPALVARLDRRGEFERVASVLGRIGQEAGEAAPKLIAALEAGGNKFQSAAAALAEMGPAGAPAVEPLRKMLHDEMMRDMAARALGSFEQRAAPAVDDLIGLLADADPTMRDSAAGALGGIGDARAVEPLLALLDDPEPYVRRGAVYALGRLGKRGDVVAPALIALVDSDDASLRDTALSSLGSFPEQIDLVLPTLTAALAADETRWEAARSIEKLGPAAKEAVPQLVEALADPANEYQQAVAEALGAIGPDAKAAAPALTKLLDHEDKWTRRAAGAALWNVAPEEAQRAGVPESLKAE